MKHLRPILTMLLMLAATAAAMARTIDEVPNVHLADSTRYVSDPDGYLSPEALRNADALIARMWHSQLSEPAVVVVSDLSGVDVDTYATELFDAWKIGKADTDNGLLLLISVNDRRAALRTGRGTEIALTDARAARIIREIIAPAMKNGDVDTAVIESMEAVKGIIDDPQYADDLLSSMANNAAAREKDDFFPVYIGIGIFVFLGMTVWGIVAFVSSKGEERHERYEKLRKLKVPFLVATVGFIGIPILGYLLLLLLMKRARRARTLCPNCSLPMRLIDEVHDNDYLTPAQDREENIGSVDYDVWHCDECGDNLILPYVNHNAPYGVCPNCGARAEVEESNSVLAQPTTSRPGVGQKTFYCKNCNRHRSTRYEIPKIVAPAVILPMGGFGGRGGGGFGGGGFGGGSFGGGSTGGGGASGGW
ncbi:MAG: hypothetical protein HDS52_08630 [Barnesiella sp.]|nr:hypothetical protein [Barnesiella sp.]